MDHISDSLPKLQKVTPTRRKRLTVTALQGLRSLAKRYEVGDPDMPGLQIRIDAALTAGSPGAKSWQWRFSWKGKRQKLGLGIWPDVSQAEAHDRVRAARALLERGIDPRQAGITRERCAPVASATGAPVDPHSVAALCGEFMRRYIEPRIKHPADVWIVPPENAKTAVQYRIPLVPAAVAEFQRLKKRAGRSRFVMPADSGTETVNPLLITRSVARHLPALAKHDVKAFVLHDLRRTVRTGLSALEIQPHIAERCLNHKQRGVAAAYDVFQYADEKREALTKWAEHLATLTKPRAADE
jgi:hypothetical protein